MVRVTTAKFINEYNIHIEFNDGTNGILNFKKILEEDHREIVKDLLNEELFKTVKVYLNTLCWENEVDFAPDYLYEQILKNKEKEVA